MEVQLRTIAMESWANLEHKIRYKKNLSGETLMLTDDLMNECAQMSSLLDQKMQQIRKIVENTSAF